MKPTVNVFESIRITHIINPHMFWFRPESAYCINNKYMALEHSLNTYLKDPNILIDNRLKFSVGEMAVVFMDTWDKWIRVIVDENIEMVHKKCICVLWAVDWGFPFQTNLERLRPIPAECAAFKVQDLYLGGLNSILPSESGGIKIFSNASKQCKDWSELVVQEFHKLIDQASNIKFIPETEDNDHHVFGRLVITTHDAIVIDAQDVLLAISEVMQIKDNNKFFDALKNCNTTKIKRYYNNSHRLSFADLDYNKVTSNVLDTEYATDTDFVNDRNAIAMAIPSQNIVNKVIEWDNRNFEANSVVDVSDSESELGVSSFNDDALDDALFESVSCCNAVDNFKQEQHSKNYYDDQNDKCFVKRGDQVRQVIQKKYQNKMPRPAKIMFELMSKEENIESCSYFKKINDTRKTLFEKDRSNSSVSPPSKDSDIVNNESSRLSYIDKIKEKRARALKALEEKHAMESGPNQNTVTKSEQEYKKEEQKRHEIKQSIRGHDRTSGLFPAGYPVNNILQDIIQSKKPQTSSKNYTSAPFNNSTNSYDNNNKSPQKKGSNINNFKSLQERLEKIQSGNTESDADMW